MTRVDLKKSAQTGGLFCIPKPFFSGNRLGDGKYFTDFPLYIPFYSVILYKNLFRGGFVLDSLAFIL
ncbi:hypothetical protein [Merdimmobilis hominis]|uniref:hypothetical protein n=1 Tax=Merdimmobilis hominis TaxID=2897707 RepID=UPI003512D4F7